MASNHSNIGRTIREKRLALGLTQVELANMLHITQGTLAQYENGKRNPKVAMVQRFADAFGVPWMDLYEDNVELNCALKEDFRSRHDASEVEQNPNLPVNLEIFSSLLSKDAPFPPDAHIDASTSVTLSGAPRCLAICIRRSQQSLLRCPCATSKSIS